MPQRRSRLWSKQFALPATASMAFVQARNSLEPDHSASLPRNLDLFGLITELEDNRSDIWIAPFAYEFMFLTYLQRCRTANNDAE